MRLLEIREISVESITSLDDAVALMADCKLLQAEYPANKLPVPEWLGVRIADLGREIESRRRDYLAARLRKVTLELEGLKTRDERVTDKRAEQVALKQQLGIE